MFGSTPCLSSTTSLAPPLALLRSSSPSRSSATLPWPDLHQHWISKPPWRSDPWRPTTVRSGCDDDKPPWTNRAKRSTDPTPPSPFEAELQATVAGNPTIVTQTTPQLSQTQPDRELAWMPPSPSQTKEESDHQITPLPRGASTPPLPMTNEIPLHEKTKTRTPPPRVEFSCKDEDEQCEVANLGT